MQDLKPHRMFRFRPQYLLVVFVLFLAEVSIALFVNDTFVRPYVGDFLVVILLYYFVKTFVDYRPLLLAIAVLLLAYCIEILQYLHVVNTLGLQHSAIARTILGTSFEWTDLLAYTLGIGVVLLWENKHQPEQELKR